jgi:hypothetical protein
MDGRGEAVGAFSGWFGWFRTANRPRANAGNRSDGALTAFARETPDHVRVAANGRSWAIAPMRIAAVAAMLVGIGMGTVAASRMFMLRASTGGGDPGRLTLETRPAGAAVTIDGVSHGVTPMVVSVSPGSHSVIVRGNGDERVIPLTISPGADLARYLELQAVGSTGPTGGLSVITDPPGLHVSVDGRPSGISPLTIGNLSVADHKIKVTNNQMVAERRVRVVPGSVASVVFALSNTASPATGWLSVNAPFDVQILEQGEVIGTNDMARITLRAGPHEIVMLNRALGYQESRNIVVSQDTATSLQVIPPDAAVSVNARPWADLIIDGRNVGQTPIANLPVSIGVHEIVFRHPQLGERRQRLTVTAQGPNRIAVDLTK